MKYLKRIQLSALEIWHVLKPNTIEEQRVFILLFLFFAVIATIFCIAVIPNDTPLGLLGYDTGKYLISAPGIISPGYILAWNLRHPLYKIYLLPVTLLNEGLLLLGINLSWPLYLLTSTFMMSCSGLFIFKSLRAIKVDDKAAYLLLLLFCSFAHTIMLSIQVDSFVMSMFFCSAMTLLFVRKTHNKLSDNLLFLGVVGTTSTNFVKIIFYQLLEERLFIKTVRRFILSLILFACLFTLTVRNLIFRIIEYPNDFLYAILGDTLDYQGSNLNRLHFFLVNFISEPIIFHHTTGIIYSFETVNLPSYSSQLLYIPIFLIYSIVIVSIILNRKQPIIHLFCLCFGFDLFMHFGVGYGMDEGQLFCGHWLFFIPIIIGVLFKQCPSFRRLLLSITILCFSLLIGINLGKFILSLSS